MINATPNPFYSKVHEFKLFSREQFNDSKEAFGILLAPNEYLPYIHHYGSNTLWA